MIYGEFDNDLVRIHGRLDVTAGYTDADGDTKLQLEESPDDDKIRFDLAGTEYFVMDGRRLEVLNSNNCIIIGENAGASPTLTASNVIALGEDAQRYNETGDWNVAVGTDALNVNISGNRNVAIGHVALRDATGSHNVAVGVDAGQQATGSDNVFIGFEAGRTTTTGSGNVFIGRSAGENANVSNQLFIANSNTSSPLIYGEFNNSLLKFYGRVEIDGDVVEENATSSFDLGNNVSGEQWDDVVANEYITFSDVHMKHEISGISAGLQEVLSLRPVHYKYLESVDPEQRLRNGLIAQEVDNVLPNLVVREDVDRDPKTGEIVRNVSDHLALNYMDLIPVLIKSIQEQQEVIARQESMIHALNVRVESLENN